MYILEDVGVPLVFYENAKDNMEKLGYHWTDFHQI